MNRVSLDFMIVYHLAETAARVLWEERPGQDEMLANCVPLEQRSNLRIMARSSAVATLRWLWKSGNADQRIMVAARVNLWLKKGRDGASTRRIRIRESARRKDGRIPAKTARLLRAA